MALRKTLLALATALMVLATTSVAYSGDDLSPTAVTRWGNRANASSHQFEAVPRAPLAASIAASLSAGSG